MKRTYFLALIVCAGLLITLTSCETREMDSSWSAKKIVNIGVKAADSTNAQQKYEAFRELLAKRLNKSVVFKTYQSAHELGQASSAGKVDFLFLSPTDYIKLHESAGVEAIASKLNKGGTAWCRGTLIATKESGITKVSDIKKKRFRFGPKGSFNKYYAALTVFKESNLDYEKDLTDVSYGSGCDGIAQTILRGDADAGVVCHYSWDGWVAKQSKDPDFERLVVIGQGPKLRETAVAAAKNIDVTTRKMFLQALLSVKDHLILLQTPLKALGFEPSTDKDYDSLRRIVKDF